MEYTCRLCEAWASSSNMAGEILVSFVRRDINMKLYFSVGVHSQTYLDGLFQPTRWQCQPSRITWVLIENEKECTTVPGKTNFNKW